MLITLKYLYGILLFSLDLSLQLINMVITAAGVLRSLLNMAAPLTPGGWGGLPSISTQQPWCRVDALCG